MSQILASTLSEKQVMSTDGQQIGHVHNITMDTDSGNLETLVVKTDRTEVFGIEQASDDHIHLPATVLQSVRDHLLITPPKDVDR